MAGLFAATSLLAPLATGVPGYATAPVLVLVACMMAAVPRDLAWDDVTEALPAVVLVVAEPFTFGIATGIGLGFITYAVAKVVAGRREVAGVVRLVSGASLLRFVLWKTRKLLPAPSSSGRGPG